MSSLRCLLFVIIIGQAVILWNPSSCQDLHTLHQVLEKKRAFQDALNDNPDIRNQLQDSMDVIKDLWTVYMPQLLEDPSTFEEDGISEACINSTLSILIDGSLKPNITMPEIVPLLDATGKQGAGLLRGNLFMKGAFDECFRYSYTGYCLAHIDMPFIPVPIPTGMAWTVGLCIPKYCTAEDIEKVINSTGVLRINQISGGIRCENTNDPKYSSGAIVMLWVCGVFVALVLIGTLVDILTDQVPSFIGKEYVNGYTVINDSPASIRHDPTTSENVPLLTRPRLEVRRASKWWPTLLEFITAFSLFKTVPTLLATKQAPGVITSLNGLRVISMFWVILGHTHLWSMLVGVDDLFYIKEVLSRLSFQPVTNGFFSVDSFFFISGVLVAYLSLRQMKKKKGRFPFLHYYIHRYLRLTPVYAFVLFFTWALSKHLAYAPYLTLTDSIAGKCSQYWWTNLLYINNFHPWSLNDECVGWSWYLANDMQFYIISPLILIPLYFFFPIGLVIAGAILMCGFIITTITAGVFDFQLNIFASFAYGYVQNPNITQNFNDLLYIKPWARISPYIVGLILGYVFHREIRLPFKRVMNSIIYLSLWITAGVLLISTVYGLIFTWHGHIPTRAENVLYITFSRFAWGVGLALMVFACHNGYGWFINSFLSMPIWTPLSRMSYNAYLVHPVVLTVIYGQFQTTVHYTDITMALVTVGMTVISYGIAGILCVLVEFPLGSIEMLIFKILGLNRSVSQRQSNEGKEAEEKGR